MRGKKRFRSGYAAIGALVALSLMALLAGGSRADGTLEGKGGEVPTPFGEANRKVELADGGDYILVGRVVFPATSPFFHIDLVTHPWLENKRRSADPLYPLIQDGFDWKAYDGDWVTVSVRAEGRVISDKEGHPVYEIFLRPLGLPAAYQPDEPAAGESPSPGSSCEIPAQGGR